MDAIDILGSLLGAGKGRPTDTGMGGSILDQMMRGGSKSPPPAQQPRGRAPSLDQQAKELEDLLGVATGRSSGTAQPQRPAQAPSQMQRPAPSSGPSSGRSSGPQFNPVDMSPPPAATKATTTSAIPGPVDSNGEAILLIRAMIGAAKADGRVTQQEQQAILSRIGQPNPEAVAFLQQEFNRSVDVRDFAWSVPMGLESKVYMMSLAAIEVDTQQEVDYLKTLAHGLRLSPEACNEIHARFNAPAIF
jgi:uncharacterized membrane protein YebE (DUF533 family)